MLISISGSETIDTVLFICYKVLGEQRKCQIDAKYFRIGTVYRNKIVDDLSSSMKRRTMLGTNSSENIKFPKKLRPMRWSSKTVLLQR